MYMSYSKNPQLPRVRMEAVRLVKYRGWSTRKVARHLGYTHSAVVKWCKKDPTGGWRQIPTKSSKPHHHPRELPLEIVQAIIQKRQEIKRSAEVVCQELINEGLAINLSSVKRTLDRWGLLNKRSPWKRYHASMSRPYVEKPGDLIELDTIHLMKTEKERMYVFTLLDVHSRWTYARAYEKCNTRSALDFLRRAKAEAKFNFLHLQSDHGPEFSTHFTERSGVAHRHSRVRMPNDNAHIERFNRTIQEECLDSLPKNVRIINRALKQYLDYYNNRRLHFGINLKTPAQMVPSY